MEILPFGEESTEFFNAEDFNDVVSGSTEKNSYHKEYLRRIPTHRDQSMGAPKRNFDSKASETIAKAAQGQLERGDRSRDFKLALYFFDLALHYGLDAHVVIADNMALSEYETVLSRKLPFSWQRRQSVEAVKTVPHQK